MTRDEKQWLREMYGDLAAVTLQLKLASEDGAPREQVVRALAVARKEARRLSGDLARYASEVHGIGRDELDSVPT